MWQNFSVGRGAIKSFESIDMGLNFLHNRHLGSRRKRQ